MASAPAAAPKAKRVRRKAGDGEAAPAKRRRKAGSLSRMASLSLELLESICGHLDPGSLLAVARTTKTWRQFLMSRATGQYSAQPLILAQLTSQSGRASWRKLIAMAYR